MRAYYKTITPCRRKFLRTESSTRIHPPVGVVVQDLLRSSLGSVVAQNFGRGNMEICTNNIRVLGKQEGELKS